MTRILVAGILAAVSGASGTAQQQEWSFPDTWSYGRATIEYRHQGLHIAVNYDYSQRNHDTKWLLLDLAAASRQRFVLHEGDIVLLMPDGRTVPVAPQQQLLDDAPGLTQLFQNASVLRRSLRPYFNQRGDFEEAIRFQAFPPGSGIASKEAIVADDRVAIGELLFKSPTGSWDDGTYRLEVRTNVAVAALPLRLEEVEAESAVGRSMNRQKRNRAPTVAREKLKLPPLKSMPTTLLDASAVTFRKKR